ncbi:uracil-DNA glycosylase [Campylobacter gastrosuis]|uniref:Uracil-DNA glycosylase n=1 Tax=Campylobacter gastrosuis TaxID=2974576 RepID=A0ABT7HSL3_9BACT|nr:uracil-DNA glycosylase [Campylobacter gastrosuis]MDL0089408.1 uracil-DNA glycosylase [Campylobacter gastrosuis]
MQEFLKDEGWREILKDELKSPYFANITKILQNETATIYPPKELIFHAFNLTPFDNVKVVILGQDPYHQPNQAMGLSFSVPKGEKIPPSLANIFKELHNDLGIKPPKFGDLSEWARQGVFLLNATLSVQKAKPNSHAKIGWQIFSDAVTKVLDKRRENLVFMLWGNYAKAKSPLIDAKKHLILSAAHPSPLARGAFFGCSHFSLANKYLTKHGKTPIIWDLA